MLLSCQELEVRRGRRVVLSDVSLAVHAGDMVRLSGANGSGKTSLLRVLSGIASPRQGRVGRARPCAYVPEKVVLASSLQPAEWLDAMGDIRGRGTRDWACEVVDSGLGEWVLRAPSGTLSKGMLQRIALIEALHSGCPVLLLDEPFAGLDDTGRDWLAAGVAGHVAAGGAAILTDHSGAAGARLPSARTLALVDGRCVDGAAASLAATVRIVATRPSGERVTREVAPSRSDATLQELLTDGWHIEAVGR